MVNSSNENVDTAMYYVASELGVYNGLFRAEDLAGFQGANAKFYLMNESEDMALTKTEIFRGDTEIPVVKVGARSVVYISLKCYSGEVLFSIEDRFRYRPGEIPVSCLNNLQK